MKTLPCYRRKCWHWKYLSMHYLIRIWTHAGQVWSKSHGSKCTKFCVFFTKTEFFLKTFRQNIGTILRDGSVAEKKKWIFNFQITILQFSSIWWSNTCKQVKSFTEDGRPYQFAYETLSSPKAHINETLYCI